MGTRILVTNHPSMNDLSMRLILMSFCYHSEVIHMGYDEWRGYSGGTRHSESFSSSFHHHSEVIRMGLDYGEDIYGYLMFLPYIILDTYRNDGKVTRPCQP